ncbi:glycosyltransferase [Rhodococcus hoagii]|nr:glycosyltransferase [Prescottella equi]
MHSRRTCAGPLPATGVGGRSGLQRRDSDRRPARRTRRQDYPGPFEVLVSDNGSTDGLRDHVADHPLAEKLRLRYVDASGARGPSHARNLGTAAADGDFIAYCDADDQAHPQWLRELVCRASDFDAVSGPVETSTLNSAEAAAWTPVNPPDRRTELPGMFPVAGSCNLGMWRETVDAVGPWDTKYVRGSQDVDYCLRIQLAAAPSATHRKR